MQRLRLNTSLCGRRSAAHGGHRTFWRQPASEHCNQNVMNGTPFSTTDNTCPPLVPQKTKTRLKAKMQTRPWFSVSWALSTAGTCRSAVSRARPRFAAARGQKERKSTLYLQPNGQPSVAVLALPLPVFLALIHTPGQSVSNPVRIGARHDRRLMRCVMCEV